MNPVSHFNRRSFLGSAAALSAFSFVSKPSVSANEAAAPKVRNPYTYRFKIGEYDAWTISDCNLMFREGMKLMWPQESKPEMESVLAKHGLPPMSLPLFVNILVVKIGKDVVVFDAGFGERENPEMGWLLQGLNSIGIKPEEVTMGFISHCHSDHLFGFVTRDDKPAFPNAKVYLLKEELAFWRSPEPDFSKSKRDKKPLPKLVQDVNKTFDILGDKLTAVEDGAEFLNGAIKVIAAPGHTAGHACFSVHSGEEELFLLSDLSHHQLLMFENPEWYIAFDHDGDMSIAARKKFWKLLSGKHTRCYGFHLPWPGLGRVVELGENRYQWSAEAWSWQV